MNKKLFISVIIPVYNDWVRLRKCLSALEAQDYPIHLFEVIIVNNDINRKKPEVEYYNLNLKIIKCDKPGSYAARNKGIKHAKGDIYAFTDSDCIPNENWISSAVESYEYNQDVDLLAGKIKLFSVSGSKKNTAEKLDMTIGFPQEKYVKKGNFAVTANLFIKSAVFEKTGSFNSKIKSGGDREFCQRAVKLGHSISYTAHTIVKHPARNKISEHFQKSKRRAGAKIDAATTKMEVLKALIAIIKLPAFTMINVFLNKDLNTIDKVKVNFLILRMRLVAMIEFFNVVIGDRETQRL